MTVKAARWTFGLGIVGTIGAILVVAALLPLVAQSKPTREIVIVARDMAFFNADGVRNPTIQIEPGERVTITLVNDDPGFEHDFAVPAWSVATPLLSELERTSIQIEAPASPQVTEYVCSIHRIMMAGRIEVRAP